MRKEERERGTKEGKKIRGLRGKRRKKELVTELEKDEDDDEEEERLS